MTLQNQGGRPVFRQKDNISSSTRAMNHCEFDMEEGVKAGLRIIIQNRQVITEVEDADDVSYRICAT